jgi:hypothetical protein
VKTETGLRGEVFCSKHKNEVFQTAEDIPEKLSVKGMHWVARVDQIDLRSKKLVNSFSTSMKAAESLQVISSPSPFLFSLTTRNVFLMILFL